MKIQGLEEFLQVHGVLLANVGLPPSLHEKLFHKLSGDVLDGGRFFQIEPCEGVRQRRLILQQSLRQHEDVFLIDHAWSFRLTQARSQVGLLIDLFHCEIGTLCSILFFLFLVAARTNSRVGGPNGCPYVCGG